MPTDTNITVTFSEEVTAASGAFALACTTSGAVALTVTPSGALDDLRPRPAERSPAQRDVHRDRRGRRGDRHRRGRPAGQHGGGPRVQLQHDGPHAPHPRHPGPAPIFRRTTAASSRRSRASSPPSLRPASTCRTRSRTPTCAPPRASSSSGRRPSFREPPCGERPRPGVPGGLLPVLPADRERLRQPDDHRDRHAHGRLQPAPCRRSRRPSSGWAGAFRRRSRSRTTRPETWRRATRSTRRRTASTSTRASRACSSQVNNAVAVGPSKRLRRDPGARRQRLVRECPDRARGHRHPGERLQPGADDPRRRHQADAARRCPRRIHDARERRRRLRLRKLQVPRPERADAGRRRADARGDGCAAQERARGGDLQRREPRPDRFAGEVRCPGAAHGAQPALARPVRDRGGAGQHRAGTGPVDRCQPDAGRC